jgi:hypothetical protein
MRAVVLLATLLLLGVVTADEAAGNSGADATAAAATVAKVVAVTEVSTGAEGEMETNTDVESELEADPTAPRVVTAYTTPGGAAAPVESTVLLLHDKPAVRLLRVDGEVAGKNQELTLVTTSMPKPMRDWIKSFIAGKYKKRKVSLHIKTAGTGTGKVPTSYSRINYKGVMIKEVQFPALGTENGKFHIKILYQGADEIKNQKPIGMLDVPVRSQFFQFTMKGRDGKDKVGAALGKSVSVIAPFTIVRENGWGKQASTSLDMQFPATEDILPRWRNWFTRDRKRERHGKLTLFYWTGSTYDYTENGRGQLRVLFELHLNDVSIQRFDTGEGKVTLKAGNIDMSDH